MTDSGIQYQWGVVNTGWTDTSGRPIFLTRYHKRWFQGRKWHLAKRGIDLHFAQGAFMATHGGAAVASGHFHDRAGCVDISTRNLTDHEKAIVIDHLRSEGAAAWLRDMSPEHGGMPEHIHYCLGVDQTKSPDATQQFANYIAGDAGLAGDGRDYHARPNPLVTVPSTPPYNGVLRAGARGGRIKAIQRGLRAKGYSVTVDGIYGPVTQKAVRTFKVRRGWMPTSNIGSKTYWAITPK